MRDCKETQFTEKDIPDLSGRVVIVTGGNSGIGYETTLQLALHNARIYIASRSEERVSQAIDEMRRTAGQKQLDLHFLQIDLKDLKSVKAAAAVFRTREPRLDILINNAGVMAVPFELTKDGYESTWQVNYLSPFIFTLELLPLMSATASQFRDSTSVRVIDLSSDMSSMLGPKSMQLDDVNMSSTKGATALLQRYAHSKQGSIRHAKELNDRYSNQGVTAYSLHPGVIKTNLQGHDPSFFGTLSNLAMKVTPTVSSIEGARNTLYCATSAEAPRQGAGRYFVPVGKLQPKVDKWIDDREGNAALWKYSEARRLMLGSPKRVCGGVLGHLTAHELRRPAVISKFGAKYIKRTKDRTGQRYGSQILTSGNMGTRFEFVISDPLSNPKPGRKSSQIRSRCMQGKNKREGSRRSKKEQRKLAQVKESEEQGALEQQQRPSEHNAWELTPVIRPSRLLDHTRFADPSLPAEAKGLLLRAVAYDITNTSLLPFDCCVDFESAKDPNKSFEWLYTDTAFLHSMLTTSYAVHDFKMPGWSGSPVASQQTVMHLHKTLSLLQTRMQNQYAYQEEPVLHSVLNLAMLAAGFGEWKPALAHLGGLQRIVQLRGDLDYLATRPNLHFKLNGIDLVWTLASGKEPFFTRVPTSWDSIFPSPRPSKAANLLSPPLYWDMRLVNAFTDLQTLSLQINQSVRAHTRYNAARFSSVLTSVQSRLTYLRGALDDPLQEVMRLAMLALMTTTFAVPGRKTPYNRVVAELPELYPKIGNRECGQRRKLLLWALIVFVSTVVSAQEQWLREAWNEVAPGLNWMGVREILAEVMWIEVAHDGIGEMAFDQLQVLYAN
ncbi:hypothetical protein Q7P37_002166 [Cladosporium fusiforme]